MINASSRLKIGIILLAHWAIQSGCSLFPTRQTMCSVDRPCTSGQFCNLETATCEPALGTADMTMDLADLSDPTPPPGMIRIPGGTFNMGSPISDTASSADERPEHDVTVASFYFDITEVTQGAYRLCVNAGECTNPDDFNVTAACNWGRSGRENHPANCIDWSQAKTYCEWRGARLPTEEEWEYAARGTRKSKYPYGDDTLAMQGCFGAGGTCAVGSYPKTLFGQIDSEGINDLLANVAEWTSTIYCSDYTNQNCNGRYVTRGSNYLNANATTARAAARNQFISPTMRASTHGVRCAKSF